MNMTMHIRAHVFIAITAFLGYGTQADAQTVDYGSLQSLFGEPITTSATGTPQRASDVATNMTIITADEIRQSGSRSIPQIIGEYVPGIDVLQSSIDSFDVGVRGYQQPYQSRLLVLLDGRQVFIDDYSRTIWDNIPVNIDDIRQIEVVKGASSALFGSNAAGGVINIITYSPLYDKNTVANATLGTQSQISGDATISSKLNGVTGIKISAGGMTGNEFGTENSSFDAPIQKPEHHYVIENSLTQVTPNAQIFTELSYAKSTDNLAFPFYDREGQEAATYSMRAGFSWQTPYGLITDNNYINHANVSFIATGVDPSTVSTYNFTNNLLVSQLSDQFKVGADNTFRAALEFRNKTFNNSNLIQDPLQAPAFNQNVFAASGTWLWQINDKLSLTNALRVDHQTMAQDGTLFADAFYTNNNYDHDINTLSANSGFVYKATDKDTFRATYGRGVQLPSLIQSGYNETLPEGGGIFLDAEGNPALKPTIVENYELDYDRQIPKIFSTARVAVYYESDKDIIGFLNSQTFRLVGGNEYILDQSTNIGNSHGVGFELGLKGSHPSGFRWNGSYSLASVHDSASVASLLNYADSSPEHHFRLSGGYTTGPWELDANGQYMTSTNMFRATSNTSTYAPFPVSGYASLGGRIGYKIDDRFTVALLGTNIAQSTTQENPYPAIERQVFLSLTGKF